MTTRTSIRETIRNAARGDINRAIDLALEHCASQGFIRAEPLSIADLELDDREPLDTAAEQSPHG